MLGNINLYEGDRDFFKAFSNNQANYLGAAGHTMCSDELRGGPILAHGAPCSICTNNPLFDILNDPINILPNCRANTFERN
jgi:hypothetical protein